jgi:hypothetical protein
MSVGGTIVYVVISVIMFFVGIAIGKKDGNAGIGMGILFGLMWPFAIIYLFLSLFYGVGKYL